MADILLRRYGVVFRRLLEREADWLPPWHALLRVFRRLEAQGKIRGGRFVAGMSGEQYALADAVAAMRAIRRQEARGDLVSLSAADPLNLTGIITPGARVPALDQQSRAVPRRCAGGDSRRRPVGFPGGDGAGQGMGSAPGIASQSHHAGTGTGDLRCVRLIFAGLATLASARQWGTSSPAEVTRVIVGRIELLP